MIRIVAPPPLMSMLPVLSLVAVIGLTASPGVAQVSGLSAEDSLLAADIFEELIEIPSVSGSPEAIEVAEAAAARLIDAGFPAENVLIDGPEGAVNLIARYPGSGEQPPILLLAHLDVVDAHRGDWSVDPFDLIEDGEWWYGRGTVDNKAGAAILLANLIRYRNEGFEPNRDLIVVLTTDEETNSDAIKWVVGAGREHIGDPAYALNTDSGGGVLRSGVEVMNGVQASEKMYLSFRLEVTNPGGHSSRPRPDNAIYTLARGLTRIEAHTFPVELNEVTQAFFERSAALEAGELAADMRAVATDPADSAAVARLSESPYFNALLRTTCIATRLDAGHADNALPQTASAIVNCRILPGKNADDVERRLNEIGAEPNITIRRVKEPTASPPSPLTPEILGTIERLTDAFWPGVPVVPVMSTGATDGLYVRNAGIPVYGVSAIFGDPDDARAHGKDERIGIQRFYESLRFWYALVRELSGG